MAQGFTMSLPRVKKTGASVSDMEQSQRQEHSEPRGEQEYGLHRCSSHPDVETGLACGKCGKYICPRCMIQTPVGSRCRECAGVTKLPTFDVNPSYYLRAGMAGAVVAVVAGIVWWGLWSQLNLPLLLWWLSAIGVGYLVGEAIGLATNRKRGPGLAVIAGLSMTLFVVTSGILASVFILTNIFGLLILGIAFYIAISRVR